MHILYISSNSPELSIGGIERHIQNLLSFCPNLPGHHFSFLLPKSHKPELESRQNITIHRQKFLNFSTKKVFGKRQLIKNQLETKASQLRHFLSQLHSHQPIDLVVSQGGEGLPPQICLSLHMVCLNHHLPLFLRVHSFPTKKIRQVFITDLPWTKILPVSKSVAGDLLSKGAAIDKISTHYLGVNKKQFHGRLSSSWLKKKFNLPADSKIIFHASRITDGKKSILQEKGLITLLSAFSKLTDQQPDLFLIIAAAVPPKYLSAEYQASLTQLQNHIQLHPNITSKVLIRTFKMDQIPKAYAGSDIFVLASENETFGQVFLEAMACGTPVIGTNVGGIPEIITDHHTGFLIAPDDPSLLSQKIQELLYNPELRKTFIKNGLKLTSGKFSGKKQFRSLLTYLESQI